ncbi:MAG TPA: hypothetical protein VMH04_10020 [Candidatus Solibacter sp.]|nr:hypothetical protein [Candidatus Solibacter sp.]
MSEPTPPTPAAPQPPATASQPPATPVPAPTASGPTIRIGEEFGTAKKNLPPAKMLLIAIAAVLVVVVIASFVKRAKPQASGSLDNVVAVEIPGQNSTMAALTFTLRNTSDTILYVRTLQGKIKTSNGETSADAVSAIDFDRYFQAFPTLKAGAQPALTPETKIQPGETAARTIIVAFPVTLDAFNARQSTSVVVQPYDQTVPVVMTK